MAYDDYQTVFSLFHSHPFRNNAKYQKYVTEGMVCNTIGLLTIFYGILVLHLVKEAAYRRLALPEDEMVLTENE